MSTGGLPSAARSTFHVRSARDHRDRGAHRAVRVVLVRDRHAEAGHDRVADELVEHAAFALDAVDHQRRSTRSGSATVPCGPSCSVMVVKLRMSEKSTVARRGLAAQRLGPARQQLVGDAGVHVARHRRLHALLVGDVLDQQHRAQPLLLGADTSGSTVRLTEMRSRRRPCSSASIVTSICPRLVHPGDLLQHPGVRAARRTRAAGAVQDLRRAARAGCAGPAALQVTILPASSSVTTPFDIDSSIASL